MFFREKIILFLCALLALEPTLASSVTPYSNAEQKRRVFSLTSDNNEDTRIDHNEDKRIDYWKIKKGSLIVEVYYRKDKTLFHIRKFEKSVVQERLVSAKGKSLRLLLSSNRKPSIFNYSKNEIMCTKEELRYVSSLLEGLKVTTIDIPLCTEKFISNDCFELSNQNFSEVIGQAIEAVYKSPSENPKTKNNALECLSDSKVKKQFVQKFGPEIGDIEYEKALIGYKQSILNFTRMQDGKSEPILYCKQTDEKQPNPPMRSSEKGQIQVQVKKNGEKYTAQELEQQLFHETLHLSSVTDEKLAAEITSICFSEYKTVTVTSNQQVAGGMAATVASTVSQANIAQAEKNSVAIPASVEIPLPPPTNASPVDMNRVAAIESTERVQSISNSQTSGIVRMAEGVLAATPAVAATGTLAKSTSTGSSGSRLPASDYSSSPSASKSKNPAAELLAKNRSKGLKPGEYIKEEIDLTKQVSAASSRSAANAGSKAATAVADRNSKTAAPVQPADESNEFAGSAAGGGSGRSSSASLSPSSGGGGQRRPQQRGTAAMGSASAQPVYGSAREEVVSVLSTNSYREAQRSLKDKNFLNKLKESKVTVYDFNGNTYGATKGEIVFVDQGDRFVREK